MHDGLCGFFKIGARKHDGWVFASKFKKCRFEQGSGACCDTAAAINTAGEIYRIGHLDQTFAGRRGTSNDLDHLAKLWNIGKNCVNNFNESWRDLARLDDNCASS